MTIDAVMIVLFAMAGAVPVVIVAGLIAPRLSYRWRDPLSVSEAANATGAVELEGTADRLHETVRTPFTDTACLVYECTIEAYADGDHEPTWQTVYESVDAVPFLVTDGESLLVDPRGAERRFEVVESTTVEAGEKPPEPFASFARQSYGAPLVAESRRRFRERRLDVGESVRVRGQVDPDSILDSSAASYRPVVGGGDAVTEHVVWDSGDHGAVRPLLRPVLAASVMGLLIYGLLWWRFVA